MNGGYAMIDFAGVTSGTNAELAKKIRNAIASNKSVIGYNINGRTPIALSTIDDGELVGNGVDITVVDDAIVISNLLPNSVKIVVQPQDATVADGVTATFSVTATGATTLSYQWYYRDGESGAWTKSAFVGNKTASMGVAGSASRNGYQYCCIVSDAYSSVVTNPATLTVTTAQNAKPGENDNETVKNERKVHNK